jgi:hypothetical protein
MKNKLQIVLMTVAFVIMPYLSFGQSAPDLGAASGFALFNAGGAFDSFGATHVIGDIGSYAVTPTINAPGVITGTVYISTNPFSATVATAVDAAYADLFGRTPNDVIGVGLGGQTLLPGVHSTGTGAAATLTGNLTLDAQGNPNAVFIIKIDGAFSTAVNSNVLLAGSASSCNVYWQVTGAFTLGDNSVFRGTLVAGGAIELLEGSSLFGRALTKAGAIHLHNNIVTLSESPNAIAGPNRTICLNESSQIGSAAVSGSTYSWTSTPAGFTSTAANPTVTPLVTTTYTVVETITATGCTDTNSVVVTVNPLPDTSLIYHNL